MKIVTITDVCDIQVGKTPSRNNKTYWGEGALWLSIADMNQGSELRKTKETITQKAIQECNCKLIPSGTVLFSFKLSIGKVGINKVPMYTNEAIAAFIIKDDAKLNTKFLYYVLKSVDHNIGSNRAVMGKTLNKKQLEQIKIPLPPLEDQKRIVAVLDQADSLRQKRQKAISLLDDYLKAVFLEMFGDPVMNPKGIKTAKIKDLGDVVTGNTPSRKVSDNYGDFIEWIKSDNINNHHYYLTKAVEYLSGKGLQKGRSVPAGSILVTCIAGSLSCIGNVSMTDRKVAFNQQINAIVPKSGVESSFLYSQILFGKKKFRQASTNSMKGMLSKSNFSEIELMNPDINLQKEYSRVFSYTYNLKQKMLKQNEMLKKQFQALVQKSFKI